MLKRLTLSTAVGGLAVALAAPAFAAGPTPIMEEPVVLAPPPPAGTDWTGPYAGAQLGWGWANAEADGDDIDDDDDDDDDDDIFGFDTDGDGVIGGITAGYRFDLGQFVVGAEGQYDWADIELDEFETSAGDVAIDGTIESVGRIKGIAGYDAGRALIYGSAGWAIASAEIDGEDFDSDGWVVGAGVDYLVTEQITVGGEVMYHQFDDFDDSGIDIDATTVQLKTTFRF